MIPYTMLDLSILDNMKSLSALMKWIICLYYKIPSRPYEILNLSILDVV